MMLSPSGSFTTDEWRVLAVGTWMLIWWISEAVPIAVTSLLPIALLPFLGVMSVREATAPYGSHIVFLFLGGFMIALAMEKWELHRRIALNILKLTGTAANRVVLGFMLSSALLSMWISNTATTVMMLPIAMSVISLIHSSGNYPEKSIRNFDLSLLLGTAYAANAGGIATLIGTPPNLVLAGYFKEQLSIDVSFFDWMKVGLPFSLILLFITYWMLVKLLFPSRLGKFQAVGNMIQSELSAMGKPSRSERRVLYLFLLTASLWVMRGFLNEVLPFLQLNDTGIAITAAILLFIIPGDGGEGKTELLNWKDTKNLPWGILLLFGGGLCLAGSFKEVGLIDRIGETVSGMDLSGRLILMLVLSAIALFLTEVMSNVALTTVFVPVVAAIAIGIGLEPEYLAIPVTIAASCAFMLPMSTPPNAIVFASGKIRIVQMARAGIVLNIIAVLLVTLLGYLVLDGFEF